MAGMPDIIGNVGPFAFYLELKDKGKKPTPLQFSVQKKIKKTGPFVATVDNFKAAKSFLLQINAFCLDRINLPG